MGERTKKKVELPLYEPIYCAYNHLGSGSAVLNNNPSIRNWFLNEVFILSCTKKFLTGYTSPQINIRGGTHHSNPYLDKVRYDTRFLRGYVSYVIKELLDNGYYVCFSGVDDYYIEGKSWYKQRHFSHDGLICGYDDEKKTYGILAYDSNWIYKKFLIKQSSFEKGRKSMSRKGVRGFIYGIKPKEDAVEFDPKKMLETLEKYLYMDTGIEPNTKESLVCGITVQDYIAIYIEKVINNQIPYERTDKRVMRLIWEHKKLLLESLRKTESAFELDDDTSKAYSVLVADADRLRMLYASHFAKRRDSVLPIVLEGLIKLKEKEEELLFAFLEKTKGKVKE